MPVARVGGRRRLRARAGARDVSRLHPLHDDLHRPGVEGRATYDLIPHAHPSVRAHVRAVARLLRRVDLVDGHPPAAQLRRPHRGYLPPDEAGVRGARRAASGSVEQGHRHRSLPPQVWRQAVVDGCAPRGRQGRGRRAARRRQGDARAADGGQPGVAAAHLRGPPRYREAAARPQGRARPPAGGAPGHRGQGPRHGAAAGALRRHEHGLHGAALGRRALAGLRSGGRLRDAIRLGDLGFRRARVNGQRRARRRLQCGRHPLDHRPGRDGLSLRGGQHGAAGRLRGAAHHRPTLGRDDGRRGAHRGGTAWVGGVHDQAARGDLPAGRAQPQGAAGGRAHAAAEAQALQGGTGQGIARRRLRLLRRPQGRAGGGEARDRGVAARRRH
mmetsp:Transcript_25278/g.60494  ORF Transcript_25278/g.60494 Transcript_25278/m.60494 type:complete len:386 (+) Transcript_25278:513-1670(+)